jgi:hypothetical protein
VIVALCLFMVINIYSNISTHALLLESRACVPSYVDFVVLVLKSPFLIKAGWALVLLAHKPHSFHQKEHFVNYFLTCYVLPGNDLRPVG